MVASQLEDSENRVIIEIVLTKHAEERGVAIIPFERI